MRRRNNNAKMLWSKMYSFHCLQPKVTEGLDEQMLGGPGFHRVVFCNQSYKHRKKPFRYCSNSISTTKYNFITFLPKALFEQFRRVANLYFLLVAILSLTAFSPFTPVSAIAPLVLVVGVSMTKEAVEDWHRFVQDLRVNARLIEVHVGDGKFIHKAWKELFPGDVVKIDKNQYFPSDLLFLSSSYEDGLCYVETMDLDGETNLKLKRCLESTLDLDDKHKFSNFEGTIRCEDPNPSLYNFVGTLEYEDDLYALSPNQVLLRDSKLRNTDYVYGVVIFSGHDTKVIQNSMRSPLKRSRIEKKMDYVIYVLFSFLILISIACSCGCYFYIKAQLIDWWYLEPLVKEDPSFSIRKPGSSAILQLVRAIMLFGYLIPISLYVSIEVVKILQAMLINKDMMMYDDVTCKSVEARTSNLNEELGQVEMILSDKTGTLTCNQMVFKKCSIAGVSYGGEINHVDLEATKHMNLNIEDYRNISRRMEAEMERFVFSFDTCDPLSASIEAFPDNMGKERILSQMGPLITEFPIKSFDFIDERLANKVWMSDSQATDIAMFFKVLALCHTAIPVEADVSGKCTYESESPEEVAFLIAAQEFGFQFFRRTQSTIVLRETNPPGADIERQYKLLNLLEFSSSRKRMSVIVSDEAGQIFLLCKGADSIIFERLSNEGRSFQVSTTSHLSGYAEDGLRTLAIAYRKIEPSYYEKWNSIFSKAKTNVGPEREDLLLSASDKIEKDLILLGAVAVEDKLQKGVPECVDRLSQAGIRIWLLTGDKKETATNIGFACSLLRSDMKQIHLYVSSRSNVEKVLKEEMCVQIEAAILDVNLERNANIPFALIVDGGALEIAFQTDVKTKFLLLAVKCASVICCRVSPKQKALIARLVKENTGMTILAIGDGANDVGMIQVADIGVGISGMEGMQAVMASDFSLPQFRQLERLLLVHGHWCYNRISKMLADLVLHIQEYFLRIDALLL